MAKESSQPKAVNIIRPTHAFSSTTTKKTPSVHSYSSYSSAPPATSAATTTTTTRKPRVSSKIVETPTKPQLNIYHPPPRPQPQPHRASSVLSSSDIGRGSASSDHPLDYRRAPSPPPRPHIELYKPTKRQPQILTKSFTLPSLQHHIDPNPPSSTYTYQTPASQRSVLGPINTPAASNATAVPLSPTSLHPRSIIVTSTSAGPRVSSVDDRSDLEEEEEEEVNSDEENDSEDDNKSQTGDTENEEDEPALSEARVNRKIADLEISNQSLLAVNAMLEATVRKQASQVTQLKKQMSQGDYVHVEPLPLEDKKELNNLSDDEWEKDEVFMRLCKMTDHLIEQAEAAVKFEYKGLGRVLSSYGADAEPIGDDEDNETTDGNGNDSSSKQEEANEGVTESKEEVGTESTIIDTLTPGK
ncbi:hypothetical protein EC973_004349 [Apophysomyces ossiformis]|uniref:Uncharacterized protein n=1 Tax=Apophysomyces ossiformis TaxID=679940 RepID=A0A8H7BEQ1_9FUNG|nr:hypothetical protein EC973_004349 [Apophysomyces ossiformis]